VPDFLTRDRGFRRLIATAQRAATTQAGILITGESGTGKNRLARFIHDNSTRSGPFVQIPCANIAAGMLESELFGHEPGAFTGAVEARIGRFEQADGGTLFLDEIQELDLKLQAKVLRAIQEKQFERLGGTTTLSVDVRILASSQRDPEKMVANGQLREDLFYRMNVVRLTMPPLRERIDDLPLLAEAFLAELRARHSLPPGMRFAGEAVERMMSFSWPGNLRELFHAVESAAVLCEGEVIRIADLPSSLSSSSQPLLASFAGSEKTLAEVEAMYIDEVLARAAGNKTAAARILGIHRKTLHEKLRHRNGTGDSEE
jgi:two-component system response regulator HydG